MGNPFGAGAGFAEGLASIYAQRERANLETAMAQRAQLGQLYVGMAGNENARPEVRLAATERAANLLSTPLNKKLDKQHQDFSWMGGDPGQQAVPSAAPGLTSGQPGGEMATAPAAAPQPPTQVPLSGAGLGGPGQGGQQVGPPTPASGTASLPPMMPPPQIINSLGGTPAPVSTGASPGPVSPAAPPPFYTPQERASIAAHQAGETASETINAQLAARAAQADSMGLTGVERASFIADRQILPVSALRPQTITRNISGADLLRNYPGMTTSTGEALDPKAFYDHLHDMQQGDYAAPAGLAAQSAITNIAGREASTAYYQGRTGMIPMQTARLAQQMQLDPERVAIAQANSVGRWFGPTSSSRQSAQYAADVADKIDDVQPLIASLGQSGKLGPLMGRWENFLAADYHGGDPDIANLRQQLDVLSKAVMRMHGFRNADEANKYIAQNLNIGTDPAQLMGTLEGLRTAANSYQTMAQMPPEVQAQMMRAFTNGTKNITPNGAPAPIQPPPDAANGGGSSSQMMYARDPSGKLHRAPAGTALPDGWKKAQPPAK